MRVVGRFMMFRPKVDATYGLSGRIRQVTD